jgi:uncharacterized protein YerC
VRGATTDPELVEEVVKMTSAGMSAVTISEETGLAVPTVYRIQRESTTKNIDGVALTPAEQSDFISGYDNGETLDALCTRHRVTPDTGKLLLRQSGIVVRSHRPEAQRSTSLQDAVKLYKAGHNVLDILVETGVSSTTLYKELRRHRISLRTRKSEATAA